MCRFRPFPQRACGLQLGCSPAQRTLQPSRSHAVQSPFAPLLGEKPIKAAWVQSSCLPLNHFFCFLLKNCESASSLSCCCRLADRKSVFARNLALSFMDLTSFGTDFLFPHHSLYFLFQAFSAALALFISVVSFPWKGHCQITPRSGCCIGKLDLFHPAGSIPSRSTSTGEKLLRCWSRAVMLYNRENPFVQQTATTRVRTSKM